ncbi:MAG: SCP-like extracellular [Desulfobulbus sp.]|nr:MAG: SCP-like extracellular [Desulfobulbus sp.]
MRKVIVTTIATGILLLAGMPSSAEENKGMAGMTRAHNRVRSELSLPQIAWSDELARFAQEWADYLAEQNGCGMRHRPDRGRYGLPYGENLYWASPIRMGNGTRKKQSLSPQKVVGSWVSEREDYDHSRNRCRWGKTCGHYTQVIWKATRRIGCGMATCSDLSQIWVCNYDPPGNYLGQPPY